MARNTTCPVMASALFATTIITTIIGIFLTIYFILSDPGLAYRVAAAVLVGVVGLLSFLRHSVFYPSDQARMGGPRTARSSSLRSGMRTSPSGWLHL